MPTVSELWPFLSIVAWPDGYDREQVARLLAAGRGLDVETIRMRLGQMPPMVLERAEPAAAREMVDTLVAHGGDGFLFTTGDLAALGPTLKIKQFQVVEGALDLELWEGLTMTLPLGVVQVVVRAHLSKTTKVLRSMPGRMQILPLRTPTWDSIKAEIESRRETQIHTSDKLDLHTTDGTVYQIDGDRFRFEALGQLRGYSGKANMDRMVELIAHLCPDAVIDTFFKLFRPPPGFASLRLPNMKANREDPAWAFYSRWAALTYRHVMDVS